ncbi:MAG: S41 family peptidase [Lachnospiraceae bacterium]|nr:S41 family peptidase [Lachnospiraceae bacterium]
MESKNKFWKGVLIGALVTAFAGLLIVGMSAGIFLVGRSVIRNQIQTQAQNGGSGTGTGTGNSANIDWSQVQYKAKRIQSIIQQYFLFDEDGKQVEEYIYKGLMAGLDDPYSVYYTEEEFNDLMEDTTGEYCGIGAMVTKNMVTGTVSIAKVFKGSPAEEAGLRNGDIFYQVGDVEVTSDMDLDILVKQHVKGEEGTTVHLKMYRPSDEDYVEMDVIRRQIEVPTVEYEMKADHLGYIMVSQFDDVTTEQFKAAISDLESQGIEGLLIDLRGNPGGVLDTAVDMLDYMLPDDLGQYSEGDGANKGKTLIVSIADRNEQGEKYYCKDGHSVDIPVVILMDGNSASASEVFAGAMRDYDRADLVGTTSFGKGIVQSLLPLGDGSAVKLTTAHYYSPSGFDLHGVGLEPDVEVEYEYPEEANQVGDGGNEGDGSEAGAGEEELPDNQLEKGLEVLKEKVEEARKAGDGNGISSLVPAA